MRYWEHTVWNIYNLIYGTYEVFQEYLWSKFMNK